jgi:N-acetyl-beta-hexosaminidase
MMVVVNSGTYYLDHSTLEVECESQISQVASPTFNPIPGSYDSAQTVEISTTTPGAMIYYTTNGNDPTESSAEYMQPIDIDDTTTLKARAYKDGWGDSEIAVGEYTISLSEINIVPWITPLLFP